MNLRKLITRYLVETFNLYRWATSCVILNYLWNNNLCKLGTCPTKISSELLAVTNCYCVQVQLQWLVRHQLPKNKSELEQSPLKKISIIKLDLGFFFFIYRFFTSFSFYLGCMELHLFIFEILDIVQGLTSASFVQIFPCIVFFSSC